MFAALDIPPSARVEQRIPKRLLIERAASTATDRRRINDGIEEIRWLAALKPTTVGVPEHRDEVRTYLEIAIVGVTFRPRAQMQRLVELIHRAIPYPMVLCAELGSAVSISLAHKRWSLGEAGETVVDGTVVAAEMSGPTEEPTRDFLEALALGRQTRGDLYALFQAWIDTLLAFLAAQVTGSFALPRSSDHAAARRRALNEREQIAAQMARLRAAGAKERQLARKVELNLELKRLEAQFAATLSDL